MDLPVLATILKQSSLGDFHVILLNGLLAVVAVVAVCLSRWTPGLRKGVVWAGAIAGVLLLAIVPIWPATARNLSRESDIVEWVTSLLMLAASGTALATFVRSRVHKRPSPSAIVLTVGYFLTFAREMEWGEPFFGEKVFYSRYIFRPKAWFDTSRFDKISDLIRESGHFGSDGLLPETLRMLHVLLAGAVIAITVVTAWYVIAHRKQLNRELTVPRRPVWLGYAIASAVIYVLAAVSEAGLEALLATEALTDWASQHSVAGMVVAEPLEMLGALCAAIAAVTLWHESRDRTSVAPTQATHRP